MKRPFRLRKPSLSTRRYSSSTALSVELRGQRCRYGSSFVLRSFKLDCEGSARSPSFARCVNLAAVALDNCIRDRQSQTKTFPGRHSLLEGIKYFRQKIRLDSFPTVCNLKQKRFPSLIKGANRNCPAFGCEFLSILQHVPKYLFNTRAIYYRAVVGGPQLKAYL